MAVQHILMNSRNFHMHLPAPARAESESSSHLTIVYAFGIPAGTCMCCIPAWSSIYHSDIMVTSVRASHSLCHHTIMHSCVHGGWAGAAGAWPLHGAGHAWPSVLWALQHVQGELCPPWFPVLFLPPPDPFLCLSRCLPFSYDFFSRPV